MKYQCYFEVMFSEFDVDAKKCRYYLQTGFAMAENLADCVKQIEDYYGDELTEIRRLGYVDDSSFFFMPKQVVNDYISGKYDDTSVVPCDMDGNVLS